MSQVETQATVTGVVSMSASTGLKSGYVKMILQGGPLDGEQSLVQDLPRTPGSILTFNVPNWQTFAPDGATLRGLGLQVQYALVGQGPPPVVSNGDTWDTSWIFSFVAESFIPPPAPITPPIVPPQISPSVWMAANSGMNIDVTSYDPSSPGVWMTDSDSELDVEADTQAVGWSSVSMTDTVTTLNAFPVDWSTYGAALEGDTTFVIYSANGVVPNALNAQDSDLEGAGLGDWTVGTNCTLTNNASFANTGNHSLGLTAVAAGDMYARLAHATTGLTCIPNNTYVATAYFRPSTTVRTVSVYIQWYDTTGAFINMVSYNVVESAGSWTQAVTAAAAPPGAATMDVLAYVYGAAAGELHTVDTITIGSTSTLNPYSPLNIAWDHAFWAEDPQWTNPGDQQPVTSWRNAGKQTLALTAQGTPYPTFNASDPHLNGQPSVGLTRSTNLLQTSGAVALQQPGTSVFIVFYDSTNAGGGAECGLHDGISNRWLLRLKSASGGANALFMY